LPAVSQKVAQKFSTQKKSKVAFFKQSCSNFAPKTTKKVILLLSSPIWFGAKICKLHNKK